MKYPICECGTDVPPQYALWHNGKPFCSAECRDEARRKDDGNGRGLMAELARVSPLPASPGWVHLGEPEEIEQ